MDKSIDSTNEYFKEIGTLVKQIDREKEAALWKQYKKGNLSARDELFKLHVRLVIPTARRFLRPGCELMDLVEEGNLGLLQAIEKFDYKLGYRFSTYAIHWIEQFIRRSVEEQATNIKIPQHAWENLRTWSKALERLKSKLNREPTLNEIAHELNIKAKQVVSILNTLNAAYGIDSLSALVQSDEDSLTLEETLSDESKGNPDNLILAQSSQEEVKKILESLPDRDREILLMRYGLEAENPDTLSDIAKKLKISRERVRQIEQRAVRKVRQRAMELGLIDEEKKQNKAVNFYSGMEIKQETDILGNEIAKSPLAKLIKKAKKFAKNVMSKKISKNTATKKKTKKKNKR